MRRLLSSSTLSEPIIAEAPLHRRGYYEARPGDVVGSSLRIVDVRCEQDLVADFGHIHGVTHHPRARVEAEGLPGLDPRVPVVVVCNNGFESAKVAEALVRQHGFVEVYHLVGGMLRWTAEDRPVARQTTWKSLSRDASRQCIIGLGANIGSAHGALAGAVLGLEAMPTAEVLDVSPHYATAPVGPPQPDYLNAAVRLRTTSRPTELLAELQALERRFGRVRRPDERWGPRTLDLDILYMDGAPVAQPGLVVPHPRLRERAFALAPLLAVAPELVASHGADLVAAGGEPPLAVAPTVERLADGVRVSARDAADAVALVCVALADAVGRSVPWGGQDIAVSAGSGVGFVEALIEAFAEGFVLAAAPISSLTSETCRGGFIGDMGAPLALSTLEITVEAAVASVRGPELAKIIEARRVPEPARDAFELSSD